MKSPFYTLLFLFIGIQLSAQSFAQDIEDKINETFPNFSGSILIQKESKLVVKSKLWICGLY